MAQPDPAAMGKVAVLLGGPSAEREVSLLEQLALPLLKQRNPVGREQAKATLREAAAYGAELHAALVAEGVRDLLGGSGN